MDTALIIVDEQNDYFTGGKFQLVNSEKAMENTKRVLEKFRNNKKLVAHVQHIFPVGGPFFVEGTEGAEIHKDVAPLPTEKVFVKTAINSFINTGLEQYLRDNKITKLVITGMMSHMCIDSATRGAKDLGWNDITVIEDCCATRDLTFGDRTVKAQDVHAAYMSALGFAFATITTTDKYLNQQ